MTLLHFLRRKAAVAAFGAALAAAVPVHAHEEHPATSSAANAAAGATGATGTAGATHAAAATTTATAPAFPAAGNTPARLPDGSVFLPKRSQRQLAVRTVVAELRSTPHTVELAGRVLVDPNAGGRVQAMQPGRVEAGPRGLPQLGQRVAKGETLAVVRASASAIERANQQAQAAELASQLELARRRVDRLAQLEGSVPRKDIEAARSDVVSLRQRVDAVRASVAAAEALTAPVAGVISATNVVAGQVVDARELLFEIVDPSRLVVEASAYDVAWLADVEGASLSPVPGGASLSPVPGGASLSPAPATPLPLRFLGAGRAQREGAIPLRFAATGSQPLPLAVNQPVKVHVRTKSTVEGFPVPAAALVRNAANQPVVWVHATAERFVPRPVRVTPLDGATVVVTDGLHAGDRVVVQGAALVNQLR